MSSAVNAEMVTITSQVRAACAYFARFCRRVRGCTHSGKRSGMRSWTIVERTPPRWRGYIQSEKWKTSSGPARRSTAGTPARLQSVRQRCAEGGSVTRRRSTGMPVERLLEPIPREHADRREGDDLVLGARRLGQPAQRAAQVVADPGARVGERRCVDDDAHGGSP